MHLASLDRRAAPLTLAEMEAAGACYDAIDAGYRQACCRCFAWAGCRPTYPTDPWFEPTVLDHVRAQGEAAAVEAAIVAASPRFRARWWWLCGTSDCCTSDFSVVRKAKVVDGRVLITIVPDFQDAVEATVRGSVHAHVMERSNSGRKHALLEAQPISADAILKRPYERVPMAKVLCNPPEEAKDNA